MKISLSVNGLFIKAIIHAGAIVSDVFNVEDMDHPITFLSNRSIITVRYNQPDLAGNEILTEEIPH
jgi:hypothetical protein